MCLCERERGFCSCPCVDGCASAVKKNNNNNCPLVPLLLRGLNKFIQAFMDYYSVVHVNIKVCVCVFVCVHVVN